MSEILRKFLEYVGFNDYEIENMDDVEIHFHSESREFKYFSDGYEACQKGLFSWTDREQLVKENAELKDGTILKELTEKCKKQAEQIEKMKCCRNCANYLHCKAFYCLQTKPCDKWELAE